MNSLVCPSRIRSILVFMFIPVCLTLAQESERLTVEWLYGPQAAEVASTPAFAWLDNGSCVLYDRQKPATERTLELLDPESASRTPLVDAMKAVSSLRQLLGPSAPRALPFPAVIDGAGSRALYLFDKDVFLLDLATATFRRVTKTGEEEKCVSFSPDGKKIAFVRANDLYAYDIQGQRETRLTQEESDSVLNGTLSWVYWEEIFDRRDEAYWWSPDSRSIAFLHTDESGVSIQHYVDYKPWTPRVITQRYPKIGETNPRVTVGVVDVTTGAIVWPDLSAFPYEYLVRVTWLPDSKRIGVQTLNRLQTELKVFVVDCKTGTPRHIMTETSTTWVNLMDDWPFLKDGRHFLWLSERDGNTHIYRYTVDGTLVNQVTSGPWSVRSSRGGFAGEQGAIVAVDEENRLVYFTSLEKSSVERHLYRVGMDGKNLVRLTQQEGTHSVSFRPDASQFIDRCSTTATPSALVLRDRDGKELRVLASSRTELLKRFDLQTPSLFTIHARDGFPMPAMIFKPKVFDASRKYPVIFYVYGGPSVPTVANGWRGWLWENILLSNGYLVMSVDNRSATGISKKLEETVYKQVMADGELNDLVDAVRWVKAQPYVDSTRIGIWGWSGGGSYTMLGMTRSTEFKAGIEVAGVTDFRFYDTKFAEQWMKTEAENKQGFEQTALVGYAKDLHGKLLIVHGTYDDNVHPQNAWAFIEELVKANKRFEMMMYPMRQHGIADTPAQIHLYNTMLDFWKRNL